MSVRTVKYALEGQKKREEIRASLLDEVLDRDWWYAIGFAAADGCLDVLPSGTTRVQLLSTDIQIIRDLKIALRIPTEVRQQDLKKGNKMLYKVAYANNAFSRRFLDAGLIPAKSTSMGPLRLDGRFVQHFLRGYCDGDGHIQPGVKGAQVSFVGGSEGFMVWVKGVLEQYGPFKIREYLRKDRKGHWWTVSCSTEAALPFIKDVYGREGLVLKRKLDQVRRFLHD